MNQYADKVFAALTACFLAACVSADNPPTASTDQLPLPAALAQELPRIGLPPQSLAPNECGLFLWSKTDISQFVFFARADEGTALFWLDDAVAELTQISTGGEIFGQFFTANTYSTSDERRVELRFEPGAKLGDGARISSGSIQFPDAEGWTTILPILGARVCQPAFTDAPSRPRSPAR